MAKKLKQLIQMKMSDRALLLITFFLLLTIKLGLLLLPFNRLLKIVDRTGKIFKDTTSSQLGKLVWFVNIATRYMPGSAKCLARALTMQILMTWHGYSSELCIGVAKNETGNIEAHAWLKSQNKIIIGNLPDLSRFIMLPSLTGVKI